MQHERPVVRPAGGPSADQPGLAEPVAFDGIAGWFHPACGKTAVLLASPWGYEELCSRKSFRLLGEKLAAAGISCLRFDYPGSGHSLGDAAAITDDHAWRKATRRALALSPRARMVSALGPMKVIPAWVQASTKAGFSDSRP